MSKTSSAILPGAVLVLLLGQLSQADNPLPVRRMDVFVTAEQSVKRLDTFVARHPDITLYVHTLDAIEKLEDELSKGLPADPREAKRLALIRLKQLSKDTRHQLEHAATSIATALHYGIVKYPAIVFDAEFVAYGVTDPVLALRLYHGWRLAEAS